MRIVPISAEILQVTCGGGQALLEHIENCGRRCYQSNHQIAPGSAEKFVRMIVKNGHETVLEHGSMSVMFTCSRRLTHAIVRHRMASFSQESTQYCNYHQDRFGSDITVVEPWGMDKDNKAYALWFETVSAAELAYMSMIGSGLRPEQAADVLPNCTKADLAMTADLREWRHIFKLRAARATGWDSSQMEALMGSLLAQAKLMVPVVFDDIVPVEQGR